MKRIYLLLLLIGAVTPFAFALEHFQNFGLSPVEFVREALANSASRAVFVDICLAGLVFTVFALADLRRQKVSVKVVIVTVLLFPLGLVSSMAFYFWRREK